MNKRLLDGILQSGVLVFECKCGSELEINEIEYNDNESIIRIIFKQCNQCIYGYNE